MPRALPPRHGALAALLALLAFAGPAAAMSGGTFELDWRCVANGGTHTASGGTFTLGATIGQYDTAESSGGAFTLSAGFWQGVGPIQLLAAPSTPAAAVFALRGPAENPVRASSFAVTFSLPDAMPARLELLDVAGRRLAARDVGAFGAGTHTLALHEAADAAPGVYFVRLARRDHELVRKAVVVR